MTQRLTTVSLVLLASVVAVSFSWYSSRLEFWGSLGRSRGLAVTSARHTGVMPHSYRDEFVIPLSKIEGGNHVRMNVTIELQTDEERDALLSKSAKLRDTIIAHMVDCHVRTMHGHAALEKSKRVLEKAIASTTPNARVRGIYFSEFVVE